MRGARQRGSPRYPTVLVGLLALWAGSVSRAENVDPAAGGSQYAWGERLGWLNAEPQGDRGPGVHVSDTSVTGWIWAEHAGWISLSCENTSSCGDNDYGVSNDGRGILSGSAWGEHIGWIQFRTSGGSDCCTADGTPGCTDATCEKAICATNPSCCYDNWDLGCALEASADSACSASCAASPFGVRIHGFTGRFSGEAWAESTGWINFGSLEPAASDIVTGWRCPDLDADGVCSASDNCPLLPNPLQDGVPFQPTLRGETKAAFYWGVPVDYELARGTFTTSASIGAFDVNFYQTGWGVGFFDNVPPPGSGFWYLLRPNCAGGSYSTGSPYELPGRDEALIP